MSRAGKETLIKAVCQAIPLYVMSCFQVPVDICEKMRKCLADQWWGFEDGKKKMHWRSWDWLSTPKSLGGLGFRHFVTFNQAMLGKQCWRLATEPSSLCARVLKGRYFSATDFLNASKPRSASFNGRSLLFGRDLLLKGMRWNVGNGLSIKILKDKWILGFPSGSLPPPPPCRPMHCFGSPQ